MKKTAKDRLNKYALGGIIGEEDPKKAKKGVYNTQEEVDAANAFAQDFIKRRFRNGEGAVNPADVYVAKKPGDVKVPFIDAETGLPFVDKSMPVKKALNVPYWVTLDDIKGGDGAYGYEDRSGKWIDVDSSVLNLPKFRKSPVQVQNDLASRGKFAEGGEVGMDWEQFAAQQGPGILNSLIGLMEGTGQYSAQPIVNANTMRNMSNPYSKFAFGGQVPIEVEGDEVLETPGGQVAQVKGPSHEQGGVDIDVPEGTKVFSDRIQIDGKTMQERKIRREKAMKRIEKSMSSRPTDAILKNTRNRLSKKHEAEEAEDMAIQEAAKGLTRGKFAKGTGINGVPGPKLDIDYNNLRDIYNNIDPLTGEYTEQFTGANPYFTIPNALPDDVRFQVNRANMSPIEHTGMNAPDIQLGVLSPKYRDVPETGKIPSVPEEDADESFTLGDAIGIGGNVFNAISPLLNTLNAAEATKPNVNRFRGFGKEAIQANDDAQDLVAGIRGEAINDVNTSANTARARNRNSASSVNTLRALDTATDMGVNKARAGVDSSFASQMANLLGHRGEIEMRKDQMEMTGEAQRDMADKMDTDNFYSNMADNLTNLGTNVQGIGRAINQSQETRDNQELLGMLSKNGIKIKRVNGKLQIVSE